MSDERVFTEEELEKMGGRTIDAVQAAIDAGDSEKAKKLASRMYREFSYMHDLCRDRVAALLTFVARHHGDDALEQALRECWGTSQRMLVNLYRKEDLRRRVEMQAFGLRGHLSSIRVEEDDEKFTFIMEPCGSGGKLILDGGYAPPRNFTKVEKAQPITFGREEFPVYCTHCAIMQILPMEWTGEPLTVTVPAKKIGEEPCRVYLYKDANDIPEEIYRMVGKKKDR